MFKKIVIFLLACGFAISANTAVMGQVIRHHRGVLGITQATSKVNINQADADTIAKVKGLGPKKAAAIVAYRKANGNFKSIDDLTNVKGIGAKRLAKIKQYLTV